MSCLYCLSITSSFVLAVLGKNSFVQTALLANIHCMMSCWSGSRPLASGTPSILDPQWNSSQISCCCPESWRSCSFGSVESAPSHTPAAHRWGRWMLEWANSKPRSWAWVAAELVSLPALPHRWEVGSALLHCSSERWGQLWGTQVIGASSAFHQTLMFFL